MFSLQLGRYLFTPSGRLQFHVSGGATYKQTEYMLPDNPSLWGVTFMTGVYFYLTGNLALKVRAYANHFAIPGEKKQDASEYLASFGLALSL